MSDANVKELIKKYLEEKADEVEKFKISKKKGKNDNEYQGATKIFHQTRTFENNDDDLDKEELENEKVRAEMERTIASLSSLHSKSRKNLERFIPSGYTIYYRTSEQQRKLTVVDITSSSKTHEYGTLGLGDKALGPLHPKGMCPTCYQSYNNCETHCGWIDFKETIPNPTSIDDYLNTCNCLCWVCMKSIIPLEIAQSLPFWGTSGLVFRKFLAKNRSKFLPIHNHDGYKHEMFTEVSQGTLVYIKSGKESKTKYFKDAKIVYNVMCNLQNDDLKILKFNGKTLPQSFLMTGITVVPSRIRPPAIIGEITQDHFITGKYKDILKIINQLKNVKDQKQNTELKEKLYQRVNDLINGSGNKTGFQVDHYIFGILAKKYGLIRFYGYGKRCDMSFRYVAACLTGHNIDVVAIPRALAKVLLYPVFVNEYNLHEISEEIIKGDVYRCAKITISGLEKIIPLDGKTTFSPVVGNVVYRELKDGDGLVIGRQPSLHRGSMFFAKVILWDNYTIGIHISLTGMLNADFDGDEFHGDQPISSCGKIDARLMMSIESNIPNAETSAVMISPAFHDLLFAYYATNSWVDYDSLNIKKIEGENHENYMTRLVKNVPKNKTHEFSVPPNRFNEIIYILGYSHRIESYFKRCKKHKINPYSGRGILSLALPENLNISNPVEIKDGIFYKGVLKSSNIKTGTGSIVHVIFKLYSTEEALRFISDFSKITNWITNWARLSCGHHSFSINKKEMDATLEDKLSKMETELYNLGDMPNDKSDLIFWKKKCGEILDEIMGYCSKIALNNIFPNNSLIMLCVSGGKGSGANAGQIVGYLGMQSLQGGIQPRELNGGKRMLSSILPGDSCSLNSIAFVTSCFSKGLTPSQFYQHMRSARQGLLGTAAETPDAGAIRRTIAVTLSEMIYKNGNIQTSAGKIISFPKNPYSTEMEMTQYIKGFGDVSTFADISAISKMVNSLYETISEERGFLIEKNEEKEEEFVNISDFQLDGKLEEDYDDEDGGDD